MKQLILFITLFSFFSCKTEVENPVVVVEDIVVDSLLVNVESNDSIDTLIVSDYDMGDVDAKNIKEFKENLVKIEQEYGEQWDFCTCIVKRDSVNKAIIDENLSDSEFDQVFSRSDEIDEKCKAFQIQNPNITPEERAKHEEMVRSCLRGAGIK